MNFSWTQKKKIKTFSPKQRFLQITWKKGFSFNTLINKFKKKNTKQNSLLAKSSFLSKLLRADEERKVVKGK